VDIVLAVQRAAFVEKQKSRPPRLLVVRGERVAGTGRDARIRGIADAESRKRIPGRDSIGCQCE
jgi:hypothetical protein